MYTHVYVGLAVFECVCELARVQDVVVGWGCTYEAGYPPWAGVHLHTRRLPKRCCIFEGSGCVADVLDSGLTNGAVLAWLHWPLPFCGRGCVLLRLQRCIIVFQVVLHHTVRACCSIAAMQVSTDSCVARPLFWAWV